MKANLLLACAALSLSSVSLADGAEALYGSTTIAGVVTDAIVQGGLSDQLSYQGGGSGVGEADLVSKQQGLAPMSRPFKASALAAAKKAGFDVVDHVIAYDGVTLFVGAANKLPALSFADIKGIFGCTVTKWEQIAGSGLTGTITVYGRDAASGTTDTLTSLTGAKIGSCVKVVAESDDIANATNTDANGIGYAGLSAKRDNNRAVPVSATVGGKAVLPTVATIRNKSYPLSRDLHVYSAAGAFAPNAAEQQLLDKLTDRSFLDPIVQDQGFITLD
jgi:phosphate transport system substrate-binding protein